MASRNWFPVVGSPTQGLVCIAGSFAPNGSSAITAASRKGRGWSVVRTSAGLYTLTFSDKYPDLVAFIASLQLAAGAIQTVQTGVYTPAAKTITIRVVSTVDATASEVAANANNRINFIAWFTNSSNTNRGG